MWKCGVLRIVRISGRWTIHPTVRDGTLRLLVFDQPFVSA